MTDYLLYLVVELIPDYNKRTMKKAHQVVVGLTLMLVVFIGLVLRPVPTVTEDEALTMVGKIVEVREGGSHDLVLNLAGTDQRFYINRGLEREESMENLKQQLLGQEVEIKYPSYWTPLDPKNSERHVARLIANGEVVFDELKK